jgi:psiF repeat
MKRILLGLALTIVAATGVHAKDEATAAKKASSQERQRMAECHKQATTRKLKGATRGKFVQECMHQKSLDKKAEQREKMKECEAKAGAKKLKDDARRNFMTDCMMPGK